MLVSVFSISTFDACWTHANTSVCAGTFGWWVCWLKRIIISRSKQHIFGRNFFSCSFHLVPFLSLIQCVWEHSSIRVNSSTTSVCSETENCCILTTIGFCWKIFSLLLFRLNLASLCMWRLIFQKLKTTKMYATDSDVSLALIAHTRSRLTSSGIFVRFYV